MRTNPVWWMALLSAWCFAGSALAQEVPARPDLTQKQDYIVHRVSSKEPTSGNADARSITPGRTMTILDADGPGVISHIWFTLNDDEPYALKRVVLRIYWDGETQPSVEAPIGDFFGLGSGEYYLWNSEYLSVASTKALNCFFPMPFGKHARITVTNEGKQSLASLYYNIEYRAESHALPPGTLYFHAQYKQAQPNHGWTNEWYANGDPLVNNKRNPTGADNYVFLDATGSGQYVGITMSILQNQDGWWGEGNDVMFIDDDPAKTIAGSGSEDYFLGAWGFGSSFDYATYGAPVVGKELAGSRTSVYRFHLDAPIPFNKNFKGTIEHGHANHRSDNFYTVAYWYQAEPHKAFPALPPVDERIPTMQMVGGPGNVGPDGKSTTPNR